MNVEISATKRWLERVVVGLNFCPFAKREMVQNTIRYVNSDSEDVSTLLKLLESEIAILAAQPAVETTLIVLSSGYRDFLTYLDAVDAAQRLITRSGWEGEYQLASFHPQYCFAGANEDDPANYTNRSPYPMLHILREASLERAIERYPQPETIPQQNIDKATAMGLATLSNMLAGCIQGDD